MKQEQLTRTESAIYELILEGHSTAEIAKKRFNAEKTIKGHITSILRKRRASTRIKLIVAHYRREIEGLEALARMLPKGRK